MDEGHCDQDRKHVANGTLGYQTPEFDGPLGIIASNWRVSGILSVRSGAWLNITTGVDNALNGQIGQRPNKVSDDVYGAKTLDSYLNRAAFAAPAPGTFGDLEYRGGRRTGLLDRSTWRSRASSRSGARRTSRSGSSRST